MNPVLLILLALFLNSCSSTHEPKEAAVLPPAPFVDIQLEHIERKGGWRASFQLPEKVPGIVFQRQINHFRHGNWRVKNSDLTLEVVDGQEMIYSKSGTAFDSFVVELDSYFENTPKDYEFFLKFTDESVVVFTGHFNLAPMTVEKRERPESHWRSRFTFHSLKGDHMIVLGKVAKEKLTWIDSSDRGTYVYFGRIEITQTDRFVAVIDPGLPEWLFKKTKAFLPRLFDYYAEKTKQELSFRPFVFFSFQNSDISGRSWGGGTTPGLVQLSLEGKDWNEENQENLESIVGFLAHEAAHLWNGQMFNYPGSFSAWMHEGGADAFAYRALLEFGVITKKRYDELLTTAFNSCLIRMGDYPLNESSKRRQFKNYYRCGSTLQLLVEKTLQKKDPQSDIFSFWEELFRRSEKNHRKYTQEMFIELVKDLAPIEPTSSVIERVATKTVPDLGFYLKTQFELQRLKISQTGTPPSSYKREMGYAAIRHAMKADCEGRVSFRRGRHHAIIDGLPTCKTFKNSKKYSIVKMGPYSIYEQGHKAYDYLRVRCLAKSDVKLSTKESVLRLPCKINIPKRSRWYEIRS